MSDRHKLLSAIGVMFSAGLMARMAFAAGAADTPYADAPGAAAAKQADSWQAHEYEFHYMGFTSTYSCDGLGDKLQLLLRLSGAGADAKVAPSCARGYGVPDKLVQAKVTFSSLQSTDASTGVDGLWRHVELSPHHPFELESGDCELIEQFRDTLLPMFATRNLKSQITCVPHQATGTNFSLSFDVFAPPPAPKGPKGPKGPKAKEPKATGA
jgi:hypothetical protein